MGDVVKAYFVPNGSYLMEMAEDGDTVSAVEALKPLYMKKLRGFTRGNIPTPDIPGPSLP